MIAVWTWQEAATVMVVAVCVAVIAVAAMWINWR